MFLIANISVMLKVPKNFVRRVVTDFKLENSPIKEERDQLKNR